MAQPKKTARPNYRCGWAFEKRAALGGARAIAGVDEVGRGALFGPVVAAAVILSAEKPIRGLNDSKQLSAVERRKLDARIRERACAIGIGVVDAGRIDSLNIYQASRLAMLQAIGQLNIAPDFLLVDALHLDWPGLQEAVIHGDARCASIAAASIIAKVYRDSLIEQWDALFPAFRLGSNKGYGTPTHMRALQRFGPTPQHRRSFYPLSGENQLFAFEENAGPELPPEDPED